MEHETTKQVTEEWGITSRMVQKLCVENKIEGCCEIEWCVLYSNC
ncbi:hypothetical protein AN1V17_45310 [Vallitalea sediminicola]